MRRTIPTLLTLALVVTLLAPLAPAAAAETATYTVDQGNPAAADANSGSTTAPLKTIQRALDLAMAANRAGKAAVVRVAPGMYREALTLQGSSRSTTQPITLEGTAPGVVVRGSDVWTGWTTRSDGLLEKPWTPNWGVQAWPSGWSSHMTDRGVTDVLRRRELVVVEGQVLRQVLTLAEAQATAGSFYVDEAGDDLVVHLPDGASSSATIEVGVRDRVLHVNALSNVTVRQMAFQHAVSRMTEAAAWFDKVQNVRVENSRFNDNGWGGLKLLQSTGVEVHDSEANHNGVMGFSSWKGRDLLFDGNDNSYNNWRGAWANNQSWDAGSKFFITRNAVIRNHTATHNQTHGLWFDTDNVGITVEDSYFAHNAEHGLFLENSQGPITVQRSTMCDNRDGIFDGKSDKVTIRDNALFGNDEAQVHFSGDAGGRTLSVWETGQKLTVRSVGWQLLDNLVVADAGEGFGFRATLSPTDWEHIRASLTSDGNTFAHLKDARLFGLPEGQRVDLVGWRGHTGDDAAATASELTGNLACDGSDPRTQTESLRKPAPVEPVEGGVTTLSARDSFDRRGSSFGTADLGGAWAQYGPTSDFGVDGGVGRMRFHAGTSRDVWLPSVAGRDVDVSVTLRVDKPAQNYGQSGYLVARRIDDSNQYRGRVRLAPGGVAYVQLEKLVGSKKEVALGPEVKIHGVSFPTGAPLKARLRVSGSKPSWLRMRVWPASSPEPTSWQIQAQDAAAGLQGLGGVGLRGTLTYSATNGPVLYTWDDLMVGDLQGNASPMAAGAVTCDDVTCTFDGSTSIDPDGRLTSYRWDFGDGATADGPKVSHTYAPGSYTATLTVADERGATAEKTFALKVGDELTATASDTFSRAEAQSWGTADRGGPWAVVGAAQPAAVTGNAGRLTLEPGTARDVLLPAVSTTDTDVAVTTWTDRKAEAWGQVTYLIARQRADQTKYRGRVRFAPDGQVSVALERLTGSATPTVLTADVPVPGLTTAPGHGVRVRLSATGTNPTQLRMRAWPATAPEPSVWHLTTTDAAAALQGAGTVGVRGYLPAAASTPVTYSFDAFNAAGR